MEKEYYDAQVKYINEIRSIRHDMQAHIIVLQYYLEAGDYEKAIAYLGDMKRNQPVERMVIQDTGHDLVNAIVSDTLSRSSRRIDFELNGMLPMHLDINEYDMCTLFSNMFSNAREACEKLEYTRPVITMEVREDDDRCFIVVQNPIEWNIEVGDSGLETSKPDKEMHGFGTRNMIRVIRKYGGSIDFLISSHNFRVEIILGKQK